MTSSYNDDSRKPVFPMKTKSIFIIYGDHQTRVNLRYYYESDGHYVVSSASATEALTLLQEMTPPDVILIGGDFPYLSASSFVSIVKNHDYLKNVPITLLDNPENHRPHI